MHDPEEIRVVATNFYQKLLTLAEEYYEPKKAGKKSGHL